MLHSSYSLYSVKILTIFAGSSFDTDVLKPDIDEQELIGNS